jgi:hypothetical protein
MGNKQADIQIHWPSGKVTKHTVNSGDRSVLLER